MEGKTPISPAQTSQCSHEHVPGCLMICTQLDDGLVLNKSSLIYMYGPVVHSSLSLTDLFPIT